MNRYSPVNLTTEQQESIEADILDAIINLDTYLEDEDDVFITDMKRVKEHHQLVFSKRFKRISCYR